METYIVLGKYTQKGIADIWNEPGRIEAARAAMEAAGGKLVSWYLTLGQYDFVIIAQAPDTRTTLGVSAGPGGTRQCEH